MDRWLEHLCHDDLDLLGRATGRRAGPGQVEALLADPAAYQAVFIPRGDPLLRASPFLVFALAIHQTAADLEAASFVPEWSGRQGRVAVFDAPRPAQLPGRPDPPAVPGRAARLLRPRRQRQRLGADRPRLATAPLQPARPGPPRHAAGGRG